MEIIVLKDNQEQALEKTEAVIKRGELVAVPTDTVYGIVGDATNKDAVNALYELKERERGKAFPIFVRDIAMARRFAYISDAKAKFLSRVWPGAVSIVFHHKEKLPDTVTAAMDTIAMRVPNHPFLSVLLGRMGIPLVQSSANVSGMPPSACAQDVAASFEDREQKPELIIDGGEIQGMPSVILDLTTNHPRLIRANSLGKEQFDLLVKECADAGLA